MKKIISIIAILFMSFSGFSTDDAKLIKSSTVVKDTVIKSQTFTIYKGAKGGKFIIVTAKDGHLYKKYIK